MKQNVVELNSNYEVESFVYESCSVCGEEMTNPQDIWVDVDSDKYICESCKCSTHSKAVRCMDI